MFYVDIKIAQTIYKIVEIVLLESRGYILQ